MNFASWYSKEFPEDERRDWHTGYSNYEPFEMDAKLLSEYHQKIGIESLVNTIVNSSGGHFQTYLIEGGVMVTVICKIGESDKIGIEMASRSSNAMTDAIVRLGLPLMGRK